MPPHDTNLKTKEEVIEKVKQLRADYKKLEQDLNNLGDSMDQSCFKALRYLGLALEETESSRHWLGEMLGALDVENPYKA